MLDKEWRGLSLQERPAGTSLQDQGRWGLEGRQSSRLCLPEMSSQDQMGSPSFRGCQGSGSPATSSEPWHEVGISYCVLAHVLVSGLERDT